MAIGAYAAALISLAAERAGVFQEKSGPAFILVLSGCILAAGVLAAIVGLLVGIPALRLKGDYLAIITLGFTLIVQSVLQNMEFVGASKGLNNIPRHTNIYWVMGCLLFAIFVVSRFIHSKYGRSLKAIRQEIIELCKKHPLYK